MAKVRTVSLEGTFHICYKVSFAEQFFTCTPLLCKSLELYTLNVFQHVMKKLIDDVLIEESRPLWEETMQFDTVEIPANTVASSLAAIAAQTTPVGVDVGMQREIPVTEPQPSTSTRPTSEPQPSTSSTITEPAPTSGPGECPTLQY